MAAGSYYDTLNGLYQQHLGRDITQAEYNYFDEKKSMMQGIDISSLIAGHPEAQSRRLGQYGQQYAGQLAANDQQILNQAGQAIGGSFSEMGRGAGSSGMGNAMIQAGQNLAMDRNSQLASFYGQGYGNVMGQYGNERSGDIGQYYGNLAMDRQYNYDKELYGRQQNDYNNYFKQQRSSNLTNQIVGGVLGLGGMALGGYMGRKR